MAFRGVVATVVTEACDGSSVCGDMHQKIVSILVSCVEPVWLCLFFFEIQGQLQMKWRTYVPVLFLLGVCFQPVLQVFRVRAIFSRPNSEEHQVTGSKPVSVSVLFRRLPSFWGRPRETSEG